MFISKNIALIENRTLSINLWIASVEQTMEHKYTRLKDLQRPESLGLL